MHFNIFQRQFSLPCVSVETVEPQLDGYAKGNVACGIWSSSFECKGLCLAKGRGGRGAVWQPNPQEYRAVSNALHRGLQKLIEGRLGTK